MKTNNYREYPEIKSFMDIDKIIEDSIAAELSPDALSALENTQFTRYQYVLDIISDIKSSLCCYASGENLRAQLRLLSFYFTCYYTNHKTEIFDDLYTIPGTYSIEK